MNREHIRPILAVNHNTYNGTKAFSNTHKDVMLFFVRTEIPRVVPSCIAWL